MNLGELQTEIGLLTSDPNHDRYSLAAINAELDISQSKWNIRAKILQTHSGMTLVAGTRTYALSGFTGTPIQYIRVTVRGIDLQKRSKAYFDRLTGSDWTLDVGTPTSYYIDFQSATLQYIGFHPTPSSAEDGLVIPVGYIVAHTPMAASDEYPFKYVNNSSFIMRPYDYGLAYDVAARLLLRDPSPINAEKSVNYAKIADGVLTDVIQTYKQFESEEPKRMPGGRYWNFPQARFVR